jgi:hypothetical protein
MKNMLADRGFAPAPVDRVIKTFQECGRTVPPNPAIDKQRAKFGLPPLPSVPMDEIARILEVEEGGAS